jgi:hypothetical protein
MNNNNEILLDLEKSKCIKELIKFNKKYDTTEVKILTDLYVYLLDKQKSEPNPNIKKQLDEDINILLKYI